MSEVFKIPEAPKPLMFQLEEGGDIIELPPFASLDDGQMTAYLNLFESDMPDMAKTSALAQILNPALERMTFMQKQWVVSRWTELNKESMGEFLPSSEQ